MRRRATTHLRPPRLPRLPRLRHRGGPAVAALSLALVLAGCGEQAAPTADRAPSPSDDASASASAGASPTNTATKAPKATKAKKAKKAKKGTKAQQRAKVRATGAAGNGADAADGSKLEDATGSSSGSVSGGAQGGGSSSSGAGVPVTKKPATKRTPPYDGDPRRVQVGSSLVLLRPEGWQVVPAERSSQGARSICLTPPGDDHAVFGCGGVRIWYGAGLPGAAGAAYRPDQDAGWKITRASVPCPVGAPTANGRTNAVAEAQVRLDTGLRPVGSKDANWNTWYAVCDDRSMFAPQAWLLAGDRVLVVDYLAHVDTRPMLKTVTYLD